LPVLRSNRTGVVAFDGELLTCVISETKLFEPGW